MQQYRHGTLQLQKEFFRFIREIKIVNIIVGSAVDQNVWKSSLETHAATIMFCIQSICGRVPLALSRKLVNSLFSQIN